MADTPTAAADAAAAPKVSNRVLAQYVRDMSFENILAQKGITGDAQPEIQFEVITKLKVESNAKATGDPLFVLELEYAGVFEVKGVPEDQMHPYLLVECPRITFPFLRRIVSDVTRDGGFPPLNLETIDFVALYRSEITRRLEAEKAKATEN